MYVFVCGDDYLLDESKEVWDRIFGGGWGFEKLSLKEFDSLDASELTEAALSRPLFGPSRAILVTHAGKISKKRMAELEPIIQLDESFLKVILVVDSVRNSPPKDSRIPVIEIEPHRLRDTMRWLQDHYGVSSEVATYIVENVGTELHLLHAEMEKLTIYLRGVRPPEAADVDQLLLRSERFGPFELDDALLAFDYARAIRVVGAMIDEGVQPILVLSRLARVWRQLFVGKVLEGRAAPAQIARAASVPHWKASNFVAACKRISLKRIAEGFAELLRADRAFKTSSPNPEYYFDVMLWKLLRVGAGQDATK
jgi:DNA polymerase III delta subunit